jgi:hypothetical protein
MDNSASDPAAVMAGIFLVVTFIIGFGGFLWSLILSCKRSSAAGIIMSFVFWPIGLIITSQAMFKTNQVCAVCGSNHIYGATECKQPLFVPLTHRHCRVCNWWHYSLATICPHLHLPITLTRDIRNEYVFVYSEFLSN